jgi:hypothetical protein
LLKAKVPSCPALFYLLEPSVKRKKTKKKIIWPQIIFLSALLVINHGPIREACTKAWKVSEPVPGLRGPPPLYARPLPILRIIQMVGHPEGAGQESPYFFGVELYQGAVVEVIPAVVAVEHFHASEHLRRL